jgi:hypothetical protein
MTEWVNKGMNNQSKNQLACLDSQVAKGSAAQQLEARVSGKPLPRD